MESTQYCVSCLSIISGHERASQIYLFVMQVYNITRYLKFHPGGVDWIMKGAGKDSTALFQKYHAWVNADMLLKECLIGMLAPPSADGSDGSNCQ